MSRTKACLIEKREKREKDPPTRQKLEKVDAGKVEKTQNTNPGVENGISLKRNK